MKRKVIHIISRSIWALVCLYVVILLTFHIPFIQQELCNFTGKQLSALIKSEVTVGNINPGLLNKIIVDNFQVKDQNHEVMLKSSRVAVSFDPLSLLNGKIDISSAQLFGLMLNVYKNTEDSPFNFQYALDALASEDSTSQSKIDLHIGSLVIRNGEGHYNLRYIKRKQQGFDVNHMDFNGLSGHFILYRVTDEKILAEVKHLAVKEESGLTLSDLQLKVNADKDNVNLTAFNLQLPHSFVSIPTLRLYYPQHPRKSLINDMTLSAAIEVSALQPSDFQPLLPFDASSLPIVSGHLIINEKFNNASIKLDVKSSDKCFNLSTHLSAQQLFALEEGSTSPSLSKNVSWETENFSINATSHAFELANSVTPLPKELLALGDINISGKLSGTSSKAVFNQKIEASQCGIVKINGNMDKSSLAAKIETDNFNVANILSESGLGTLALKTDLSINYKDNHLTAGKITAEIPHIEYNRYDFSNINLKGQYANNIVNTDISINDPNIQLNANGEVLISNSRVKHVKASVNAERIAPSAANLTDKWSDAVFAFNANTDADIADIDNTTGILSINNFTMQGGHPTDDTETGDLKIKEINLISQNTNTDKTIALRSDFADITLRGHFLLSTLQHSIESLLAEHLSVVGKPMSRCLNDLTINADIRSAYPLHRLLGFNVSIDKPVSVKGYITDVARKTNILCNIPSLNILGHHINDTQILFWTPEESLCSRAELTVTDNPANPLNITFEAKADENVISSNVKWNTNNKENRFTGDITTKTMLSKAFDGSFAGRMSITPSTLHLGDSIWTLRSNDITYENSKLKVDNFFLGNSYQNVRVDGIASDLHTDTIHANLKNINVGYIMNLVNFHSVEFDGGASGRVTATNVFTQPEANAQLLVDDFRFQYGRMGNLHLNASLNNTLKQIDIKAISEEEGKRVMTINGQVSPQRNDIELFIGAESLRLEFMESFCSSFMKDVDAYGTGKVRLFGPLSAINLEGNLVADGALTISSLNCRYKLHSDTIRMVPNDITISHQPLHDKYGNVAYITGGLHHKNLGRMTYDFDLETHKFLCYDTHEFGDDTFYGTAFLTGTCAITGRSSELTINVRGDVEDGSRIVYNASGPENITRQEFITWHSQDEKYETIQQASKDNKNEEEDDDVRTNMHMNLLLNVPSSASLYLVMDPNTGDYIDLHGSGVLRANYYNKGAFELFGNYLIENGMYKMTIQNIIHRDFAFLPGGSITFGGDPYNATLNMQAKYTLNSVSLADLNVGRSFSSNNIKVDCLMDITGTPGMPNVSFNLNPQTANTDAKQMIYSLINSEEEMNQQVLYLLAVGRFYAQGNNNASMQENRTTSQTSLAMQSIVSGTLSQQFNNILSNVLKSNKWNFGANISPGNDGFSNGEYEGLLNGSLFNNRLLFNGQFGYRDNATTTTQGFIGDFDLRYILVPNGNVALRVYNQTNDRYFTRNSLNTQGVGIILKKDF